MKLILVNEILLFMLNIYNGISKYIFNFVKIWEEK